MQKIEKDDNMDKIIQELSNVFVTLQDIEIKGKQCIPYGMCLQTLENSILELKKINQVRTEVGD